MSLWSDLKARAGSLFGRTRADRELHDELEFHLEESTRRYMAAGHTATEARRLAQIALGRTSQTAEETRDARGIRLLEDFGRDLRHAARQLRRTPGFTLAAVLTLALGIGATTAIFSVLDGVLLRPGPYQDPGRVAVIWQTDRNSGTSHEPSAWPDYLDFKQRTRTFDRVAAFQGRIGSLSGADGTGEPMRVAAVAVTHDYFSVLGLSPMAGRFFTPAEDLPGGPAVAVLSESFWRRVLGGDPDAIGRARITINDVALTVIGVIGASSDFGLDQLHQRADYHPAYLAEGNVDVWLPLAANADVLTRDTHQTLVIGRLAGGATMAAAQAEAASIMAELESEYPQSNTARGANVEALDTVIFGPVRPVLTMLLVAVVLVLLVACVNVANLLLARGAGRAHEVAVRGALGAGAGRLGRQFLAEALLLSVIGAGVGVALAGFGLSAIQALVPAGIPRFDAITIDLRVLLAALGVTVAVGIGFGMVPTLQARRADPMAVIVGEGRSAAGGRERTRFREALVIGELALSVCLVISAGLLGRSLWAVLAVDPGFAVGGIAKAEYRLPQARYPFNFANYPALPEIQGFTSQVLAEARGLPGVVDVAVAAYHPLDRGSSSSFRIVGGDETQTFPEIPIRMVSAGYFGTMDVPLLSGRLLTEGDGPTAPLVTVVNQTAAERYFGGRDPVGQEIRFWGQSRLVVGVVGNERFFGLTEEAPPATYVSITQAPGPGGVLLARTSGDPAATAAALRRAIQTVDPDLAVYGAEALGTTLSRSVADRRFAATLIGLFAAVTIVLALIGIHGVISYATAQRSQEIGIRVALGATRDQVAGMVVRDGLRLAVGGTLLGLAGAVVAGQLLAGFLFGVGTLDLVTFSLVPAVVLVATTLAVLLPARRAARAEPIDALRGSAQS